MSDPVTDASANLVTLLKGAGLSVLGKALDAGHIFTVYDESDLAEKIRIGITAPFAGVLYGGLQSIASADPSRQGRTADMRFGILYGLTSKAIGGHDSKPDAWTLMSGARKAIVGQQAPSGHKWRFVSETYLGAKNDALFYAQYFATVVILT